MLYVGSMQCKLLYICSIRLSRPEKCFVPPVYKASGPNVQQFLQRSLSLPIVYIENNLKEIFHIRLRLYVNMNRVLENECMNRVSIYKCRYVYMKPI